MDEPPTPPPGDPAPPAGAQSAQVAIAGIVNTQGATLSGSHITVAGVYQAAPGPPAFPDAPFAVPYPANPAFAGRAEALAWLAAHLAPGGCVAVTGTGGLGKTQLAAEFAHRARAAGTYPGGIFWLSLA